MNFGIIASIILDFPKIISLLPGLKLLNFFLSSVDPNLHENLETVNIKLITISKEMNCHAKITKHLIFIFQKL